MKDPKKKEPSPMEQKDTTAKMEVLKHLHRMMSGAMGDDMKRMSEEPLDAMPGLKKVTVASNSPDGLKTALEKAQDLVGKHGEMGDTSNLDEDEDSEMMDAAMPAGHPDDEEDAMDLDRQIEELQAKKAALHAKKMMS